MFYFLSKTLDLVVAPVTWVLLLALAAFWGSYRRRPRLAKVAPLAAAGALYLCSNALVANAIVRSLEASAVTTMSETGTYDVVVVLGGLVDVNVTAFAGVTEYTGGVDRFLAGYDLVRRGRAGAILVTSGAAEAHALGRQLVEWGIAADRIVIEDQSRNTRDNAIESTRIIRERGWTKVLLVTSALHMPRAAGCFRATGLEFDTLAVDRLAYSPGVTASALEPRAEWLALSTVGIREAAGRVVYGLIGYSR